MANSLLDPRVLSVLERLHAAAERDDPPLLDRARAAEPAERAALLEQAFIPVSADAGRFLYALVRGTAPGMTIEFGTSFGISTIYLAAAVRDRGHGIVVTTELSARKAARAREHLSEAGLADLVDIRVGDATQTLQGLDRDVSTVFLDGWKSLYLPVLELLEPALRPGALVAADDLDLFPDALAPYLGYVRNPTHDYVSATVPIGDGIELSVRTS